MSNEALFVTMASWEDRFLLGSRKTLAQLKPRRAIMYYAEEYEDWSQENRFQFEACCQELRVSCEPRRVSLLSPVSTWRTLKDDLTSQIVVSTEVTVDITTMPRDVIWIAFSFLQQMGCVVNYLYHKPDKYAADWLSRDPDRPRLVYKLAGEGQFGRTTTLLILTGYDVRRTEQLIRFFEPKMTLLGLQTGSQFANQSMNTAIHTRLLREDSGMVGFDIDAYRADCGQKQIEEALGDYHEKSNVVVSSLGPKPSAVALYRVYKKWPQIALCYAPSREYNRNYSSGLGDSVQGRV
jgi:hypothetical protein